MTKRSYGDGGIDQRGENSFRLRYRIGRERHSVTFQGTLAERSSANCSNPAMTALTLTRAG